MTTPLEEDSEFKISVRHALIVTIALLVGLGAGILGWLTTRLLAQAIFSGVGCTVASVKILDAIVGH